MNNQIVKFSSLNNSAAIQLLGHRSWSSGMAWRPAFESPQASRRSTVIMVGTPLYTWDMGGCTSARAGNSVSQPWQRSLNVCVSQARPPKSSKSLVIYSIGGSLFWETPSWQPGDGEWKRQKVIGGSSRYQVGGSKWHLQEQMAQGGVPN